MIEIKDFTYNYKNSKNIVFENINLNFELGRVYGLLGRNGVGKSTLLYSIMGLLNPRKGAITYKGMSTKERYAELYAECFMVTEEFSLPKGRLSKFIEINSPFNPNFSHESLQNNLQIFNIQGDPDLASLSMGQKKKVYISFALACNTRLLIMDEPTNGLDIPSKSQFRKLMTSNMSDSKTVIISTHQVADIENLLDHIVILETNEVLVNASVKQICTKIKFGENEPNAIFSQAWAGGNYTVSENKSGEESALKLDLFFNATVAESGVMKNIFNN